MLDIKESVRNSDTEKKTLLLLLLQYIVKINKKGFIINMLNYKKQTKFTFISLLIIILLFIFSFNSLAEVKVYFSLYDDPESIIIEKIDNAKDFINIAMYTFTDREIAQSILKAKDRGVDVKIYLDRSQVNAKYTKSRYFINNGIKNIRISSNNYIMHNKFAIIDNRILLTGSYNWTFSANHRNDENLMVIDDPDVISRFQNYFEKLWFNKYSAQRTQALYKKAKKDMPDALNPNIKPESQTININTASKAELVKVLNISEPLAQKIINLRNILNCLKVPKDLLKIPELTNIDLREWEEEGIVIRIN